MQPLDEKNRLQLANWRKKYQAATGITPMIQVECWMCRAPFWTSEQAIAMTLKPCCSKQCEACLIELRHNKHWD